ncbi:hypothetical protein KUTeg_006542 [Tegillarca granosa]|uniref:Elongation of very long chain fatty acids protein n=1 Tax=Tegillarca granosa TaxID=220873 RepID=A0ABQ9FEY9_TEGGR|nr:hypothetical protein KUTeg_006542 [Tegillarca granosa]
MKEHWADSFIYSGVYLILVFGGKVYMQHRQRYELRPYLALWSGILAIFSIFGSFRTVPEFVSTIRDKGLQYSICQPTFLDVRVTAFWCALFTLSKVYELGDTMFIVLRKQQLIFLHWYHHVTVLIYTWYSYPVKIGSGRWFMTMNYVVHSFMYTYYALRAMRFNVPKFVNIVITGLQLLQMIIGSIINVWSYQIKSNGGKCSQSMENIIFSMIIYFITKLYIEQSWNLYLTN